MKEAFTAPGAWESREPGGRREGGRLITVRRAEADRRAEAHGRAEADRWAEADRRAEAGRAEAGGRWRGAGGMHQKANDITLWVFFPG